MKKALLYLGSGVILGLALVLVPLIGVAGFEAKHDVTFFMPDFREGMRSLEKTAHDSESTGYSSDLESLSVSFIIALGAYVAFKRKTLRRRHRFMGPTRSESAQSCPN